MPPKILNPFRTLPLKLETFFTDDTMSVHLKNGVLPMAKKGPIGNVPYASIREEPVDHSELSSISKELIERARLDPNLSSRCLQMGATVSSNPKYKSLELYIRPFSDDMEDHSYQANSSRRS